MALTDDQITAKNFRDFYDTIFPYLSGAVHAGFTPVGTIINVIGTTAPANYLKCDGATYSITQYLPLATYIKNQFGAYNHFGGDGVTTFAVPTKAGGTDDIYCIAIRDLNADLYVNYSENEQIIGHWIDGKPVYQKTITGNTPNTAGVPTVFADITDLSVKQIVKVDIVETYNKDGYNSALSLVEQGLNEGNVLSWEIDILNAELKLRAGQYRTNISVSITIQYTKTTD